MCRHPLEDFCGCSQGSALPFSFCLVNAIFLCLHFMEDLRENSFRVLPWLFLIQAAEALRITAQELQKLGVVDEIIPVWSLDFDSWLKSSDYVVPTFQWYSLSRLKLKNFHHVCWKASVAYAVSFVCAWLWFLHLLSFITEVCTFEFEFRCMLMYQSFVSILILFIWHTSFLLPGTCRWCTLWSDTDFLEHQGCAYEAYESRNRTSSSSSNIWFWLVFCDTYL